MSLKRYAVRRDKNEPEIFAAIRGVGGRVYPLSAEGFPDAVITFRGRTFIAEVKGLKGKLTPAQQKLHDEWEGEPILILRTVEQALREIGATS